MAETTDEFFLAGFKIYYTMQGNCDKKKKGKK